MFPNLGFRFISGPQEIPAWMTVNIHFVVTVKVDFFLSAHESFNRSVNKFIDD